MLTKTTRFEPWSDPHTFKYICTVPLTTLKMAAWVAETCQRSMCNEITFIKSKCICWCFQ